MGRSDVFLGEGYSNYYFSAFWLSNINKAFNKVSTAGSLWYCTPSSFDFWRLFALCNYGSFWLSLASTDCLTEWACKAIEFKAPSEWVSEWGKDHRRRRHDRKSERTERTRRRVTVFHAPSLPPPSLPPSPALRFTSFFKTRALHANRVGRIFQIWDSWSSLPNLVFYFCSASVLQFSCSLNKRAMALQTCKQYGNFGNNIQYFISILSWSLCNFGGLCGLHMETCSVLLLSKPCNLH